MRKVFFHTALLALVLYGSGSAVAQTADPISARLDSLLVSVFDCLDVPDTGTNAYTTEQATRALNVNLAWLCSNFDAYEKMDTLVPSADSEGVGLPADFLRMRQVFKMIPAIGSRSAMRIPLTPIAVGDNMWKIMTSLADAMYKADDPLDPRFYFLSSRRLMFHPRYGAPAEKVDSFLVMYWAQAPRLSNATDSAVVDRDLREALVYGAAAKMAGNHKAYGTQAALEKERDAAVARFEARRPATLEEAKK